MPRYLKKEILRMLTGKMVFIGGPRQVGKTHLSLEILGGDEMHPAYLNWDFPGVMDALLAGELPGGEPLVIFDEIHKYPSWRNLIKGYYDKYKKQRKFIVTGSARLDYYRHGGDALQGRYHHLRLHPFSIGEIGEAKRSDLDRLLAFGGFPEPFLGGDERSWRLWQKERLTRVIHEDLVTLEKVNDVARLKLLMTMLPARAAGILSIKSLSEDIKAAHATISSWIGILENLYVCYRIAPYGSEMFRAVHKEQKIYLWDWSLCKEPGARFENLVASQLLKYCHYMEDTEGYGMELRFIRDHDKREIDFVVLKDGKAIFAVECKSGEKALSRNIDYFAQRTDIPIFYQVHLGQKDVEVASSRARIMPFLSFCRELSLP